MFDYLLDRIDAAPLRTSPFPHLYVPELFTPADFARIVSSPQIDFGRAGDDGALMTSLGEAGFKPIDFPGCITDPRRYRRWRAAGGTTRLDTDEAPGEVGMVFRLAEPTDPVIAALLAFFGSDRFLSAIAEKFGVESRSCAYDGGIQKYLDGYQISPHPDIRRKAVTWMANIVPDENCAGHTYHTRYMRLRPEFSYVSAYWQGNPDAERCHLPWSAADEDWMHSANNSLVAFAPGNETIHAVRAWYDHLPAQRTQIYGNLWSNGAPSTTRVDWSDLAIGPHPTLGGQARALARSLAPNWARAAAQRLRAARAPKDVLRRTTT